MKQRWTYYNGSVTRPPNKEIKLATNKAWFAYRVFNQYRDWIFNKLHCKFNAISDFWLGNINRSKHRAWRLLYSNINSEILLHSPVV
ncbi:hypothetical protein [Teredinibacter purpureus]|uniref:hypothetical protein n=1 Tax=Teredinibacter purpureus TaxID=2731756 RepID=UPI000697050A|nr:hypothetical protein [Teredinibacter purpureus]